MSLRQYREKPRLAVPFVGATRRLVESKCVVSLRSLVAASGRFMTHRSILLGSAALLSLPYPAFAQSAAQPASSQGPPPATEPAAASSSAATAQPIDDAGDEEEIVVTGARPRGSVVGDIPAENILDARDVRATGATSSTGASPPRPRLRRRSEAREGAAAKRRYCSSTASGSRASASFATSRPRRSSGSRSCPRRLPSNMAIAPTRRW